jgi:hypothetical protein
MAYVGTPIDTTNTFQSLTGDRFDGDASETAFTLSKAPSSVFDIEVFVGNVRQDPNSAYTVSGTTLTFTGAPPSGTNNIYVVHQAKSVGTINVPAGGVAADSLATSVLTGQTDIGADIADADLFLVDDGAGGTLRKTAASRLKTYIDNTPAFFAHASSNQDISDDTATKVTLGTEIYDTDSAFASNRFTVPSGEGGKYFFTYSVDCHSLANSNMDYAYVYIYKNGSSVLEHAADFRDNPPRRISVKGSVVLSLSASDYIELYVNINDNSGNPRIVGDSGISTYLGGHKLIGV